MQYNTILKNGQRTMFFLVLTAPAWSSVITIDWWLSEEADIRGVPQLYKKEKYS